MSHRTRLIALVLAVAGALGAVAVWIFRPAEAANHGDGAGRGFPPVELWPSVAWRRGDDPDLAGPGSESLAAVAQGTDGVVVWGQSSVVDREAPDAIRLRGVLWSSPDGQAWHQAELTLETGAAFIPQVASVGSGRLLAAGVRWPEDGVGHLLVSVGGGPWTEAASPKVDGWSRIVPFDSGFAGLGHRAGQHGVWWTLDARVWHESRLPAIPGDFEPNDLDATREGVLLSGTIRGQRELDAAVWLLTADGVWHRLGGDDPALTGPGHSASIHRLVPFAGGLFATGGSGQAPECQLGQAVVAARRRTADHCPGLPQAAWVSQDGHRWTLVEGPRPPGRPRAQDAFILAIAPGGAGLVALVDEAPPLVNRPSLGLWTSPDGFDWVRVGNGMELVAGEWAGQDLVVLPGRIVVVGQSAGGEDLAVWVGQPGG